MALAKEGGLNVTTAQVKSKMETTGINNRLLADPNSKTKISSFKALPTRVSSFYCFSSLRSSIGNVNCGGENQYVGKVFHNLYR